MAKRGHRKRRDRPRKRSKGGGAETERCWIIYDSRAQDGDTDSAAILETCGSEEEAQKAIGDTWARMGAVVFVVDIIDGKGVNERRAF